MARNTTTSEAASQLEVTEAGVEAIAPAEKSPVKKPPAKKTAPKKKVKTFDPNEYVSVKNGFHGQLIYRDRTTGETFTWSQFGDELDMTVGELKRARSAQPRFFEDNWFIIDNPDLVEYLRAQRFYENLFDEDGFDELFTATPDEVKERTANLSKGQRRSVIYEAQERIKNGTLSDLRVIRALEESLQISLISE